MTQKLGKGAYITSKGTPVTLKPRDEPRMSLKQWSKLMEELEPEYPAYRIAQEASR